MAHLRDEGRLESYFFFSTATRREGQGGSLRLAKRGQVPILSEIEARSRCPTLVVASLGVLKKEKSGVKVTAR